MDINVYMAGCGVLLAASVLFLILKILKLKTPPCEYRTIEFRPGKTKKGDDAVFAEPEVLDKVRECALVIFSNQTKGKITIEFDDEKSPFKDVAKFELEPSDSEDQFSKGLPVAVELASDTADEEFNYKVVPDGPPKTEQSPRIRIGPRNASAEN